MPARQPGYQSDGLSDERDVLDSLDLDLHGCVARTKVMSGG